MATNMTTKMTNKMTTKITSKITTKTKIRIYTANDDNKDNNNKKIRTCTSAHPAHILLLFQLLLFLSPIKPNFVLGYPSIKGAWRE